MRLRTWCRYELTVALIQSKIYRWNNCQWSIAVMFMTQLLGECSFRQTARCLSWHRVAIIHSESILCFTFTLQIHARLISVTWVTNACASRITGRTSHRRMDQVWESCGSVIAVTRKTWKKRRASARRGKATRRMEHRVDVPKVMRRYRVHVRRNPILGEQL
jgi:hypothetical protein